MELFVEKDLKNVLSKTRLSIENRGEVEVINSKNKIFTVNKLVLIIPFIFIIKIDPVSS